MRWISAPCWISRSSAGRPVEESMRFNRSVDWPADTAMFTGGRE